jgi:hypothetical protein
MKIFITITVSILYFSLNAQIYKSNSVFALQAKDKNTGKIAADIGLFGINPKFSYSFWEHYTSSMNFSVFKNNNKEYLFGELSGGYYKKMWEKGVFELNIGTGYGKAKGDVRIYLDTLIENNNQAVTNLINVLPGLLDDEVEIIDIYTENNILRFFAQPSIGYSSKFIELSFAMRISFIHSNITKPYETKNNMLFADPVGTFGFGYDAIMLYIQAGFSVPVYVSHDHAFLSYDPILLSMGFAYRIGNLYKKNSLLY